jgi:DNA mismatch endonuclease (patch repair protein)
MALSRSEQMSRIRGTNTTPERLLRQALWAAGLRYRLNGRTSSGRPDLLFAGAKVAVFIDGCFWHGCPAHYVRPRTREEFWSAKLRGNVERDQRQTASLEAEGWRVLRIWEHEVVEDVRATVNRVRAVLSEPDWTPAPAPRVVEVRPVEGGAAETWFFVDLRAERAPEAERRPRAARR